ncbi:hypothetical protein BofuT4_uP042520.1 [Botrytis cinerea T4]|uniref:Uncharacterized protein n=1 Tax=Botryotinia fuckeliana (strain T4) TaxID=999810 RepID=G2Y1V1_BOTF4|nr:hypothetical protein BofuT4_uP042520.1 [Botrytis cinerea T4]
MTQSPSHPKTVAILFLDAWLHTWLQKVIYRAVV